MTIAEATPATRKLVKPRSIGYYTLGDTIGEGTFGKVKLGTHICTSQNVAVKILEKAKIGNAADVERVAREIHILKRIRHPHVVQLYEIIETHRQLYLIMEYADGGELFDYIVANDRIKEREACTFFHQIVSGVDAIHRAGVVHRDLKPENLLLDENGIKIVDFGLSNMFSKECPLLRTACGSPCYAAPEMIAGENYVPARCDTWSCGVILFAMLCGFLPFDDENTHQLYQKILHAQYTIPHFVSPSACDLINKLLTTDPEKRITFTGVRKHPWFRGLSFGFEKNPHPAVPFQLDNEQKGGCGVGTCSKCLEWYTGSDPTCLDDAILAFIEQSFKIPREYTSECIKMNKHNRATTMYYMMLKKKTIATNDKVAFEAPQDLQALLQQGIPIEDNRIRLPIECLPRKEPRVECTPRRETESAQPRQPRQPQSARMRCEEKKNSIPRKYSEEKKPTISAGSINSKRIMTLVTPRDAPTGILLDRLYGRVPMNAPTPLTTRPSQKEETPRAPCRPKSASAGRHLTPRTITVPREDKRPPLSARVHNAVSREKPICVPLVRCSKRRSGSDDIACTTMKGPKIVMQEITRALKLRRIAFSPHGEFGGFSGVTCHKHDCTFDVNVGKRDNGMHIVRFRWITGTKARYNELCSRLVGDMRL